MGDSEDLCGGCSKAFPAHGRSVRCSECAKIYHLGKCSGITEAAVKGKGDAFFEVWKCAACYSSRLRGAVAPKERADSDLYEMLLSIQQQLNKLENLPQKVDKIEESITMMSAKYDEVLLTMGRQDAELKELRKRVNVLEAENQKKETDQLKLAVNDLEWRSRRQNLVIHGVCATDNENLLDKVNEVAKLVNLPELGPTDVGAVHRLPAKPGTIPGIIVRFLQQSIRDNWLQKNKDLKKSDSSVHIVENLTHLNRILLAAAKVWTQNNGYRFAWHNNGKILVRRATGENAYVIKCEADLTKLPP